MPPPSETDFFRLADADAPEQHTADVLPWLHAAGNPYLDWLFGDAAVTRAYLEGCVSRASSEYSLHRITLLRRAGRTRGGFLRLSGEELRHARRQDALALVRFLGRGVPGLRARLRGTTGLFPAPDPDESYLSKMGLHTGCRGRGLGHHLVEGYVEESRRLGFRHLRLDVGADNRAAIRLYRGAGFETVCEASSDDGALHYLSMRRDLGA